MQSFETCTMSPQVSDWAWNGISNVGSSANLKRILNIINSYNDRINQE